MVNGQMKRSGKTTTELREQIDIYFKNNKQISIEMLYVHLGVTKHNMYDGKVGTNKTKLLWGKIIREAIAYIHSDLVHEIKQHDKQPNAKLFYLRSRFKDDLIQESQDTSDKVVIEIGNKGANSLLGDDDA